MKSLSATLVGSPLLRGTRSPLSTARARVRVNAQSRNVRELQTCCACVSRVPLGRRRRRRRRLAGRQWTRWRAHTFDRCPLRAETRCPTATVAAVAARCPGKPHGPRSRSPPAGAAAPGPVRRPLYSFFQFDTFFFFCLFIYCSAATAVLIIVSLSPPSRRRTAAMSNARKTKFMTVNDYT